MSYQPQIGGLRGCLWMFSPFSDSKSWGAMRLRLTAIHIFVSAVSCSKLCFWPYLALTFKSKLLRMGWLERLETGNLIGVITDFWNCLCFYSEPATEFLLLICYFYTEPDVDCFLLMMLMLVELHLRGLYVADFLLILCWSFDFVITFTMLLLLLNADWCFPKDVINSWWQVDAGLWPLILGGKLMLVFLLSVYGIVVV